MLEPGYTHEKADPIKRSAFHSAQIRQLFKISNLSASMHNGLAKILYIVPMATTANTDRPIWELITNINDRAALRGIQLYDHTTGPARAHLAGNTGLLGRIEGKSQWTTRIRPTGIGLAALIGGTVGISGRATLKVLRGQISVINPIRRIRQTRERNTRTVLRIEI